MGSNISRRRRSETLPGVGVSQWGHSVRSRLGVWCNQWRVGPNVRGSSRGSVCLLLDYKGSVKSADRWALAAVAWLAVGLGQWCTTSHPAQPVPARSNGLQQLLNDHEPVCRQRSSVLDGRLNFGNEKLLDGIVKKITIATPYSVTHRYSYLTAPVRLRGNA
jgi:hypothetical protein